MTNKLLAFLLTMSFASAGLAQTRVIYVSAIAPLNATANGTSWAKAFKYLQTGLATAKAMNPTPTSPVEIWVAKGTYFPDQDAHVDPDTDPRDISFEMAPNVSLYGGFSGNGTESDRKSRKPDTYVTVLSGNATSGQSRHVVAGTVNEGSVLSGFTIANGHAFVLEGDTLDGSGAGIHWSGANGTVEDCLLTNNVADRAAAVSAGIATFRRVRFLRNSARTVGGAYADGEPVLARSGDGRTFFINCVFAHNEAGDGGGALFLSGGDCQFRFCTIADNSAASGSGCGVFAQTLSCGTFINCLIKQNLPGDIQIGNDATYGPPNIIFSYCNLIQEQLAGADAESVSVRAENYTGEPSFVDSTRDDYRLRPDSQCIDQGRELSAAGDDIFQIATDFDHNRRFFAAQGTRMFSDPGAFEYGSQPMPPAIYLDPAGTPGDGYSWTGACNSMPAALEIARLTYGDVQEVWVKKGKYSAPSQTTPFQFDSSTSGLTVRGGFSGQETSPDGRRAGDKTVLTGDLLGNDSADPNSRLDNANFVVRLQDTSLTLERFTIASGTGISDAKVGGVSILGGSPIFRECDFVDNMGDNAGGVSGAGAFDTCTFARNVCRGTGPGAYTGGPSRFVGCTFSDNAGGTGGAQTAGSSFIACTFLRNAGNGASGYGGAIGALGDLDLLSCGFYSNSAAVGGAVNVSGGRLRAWQSIFVGNSSTSSSGAVYCQGLYGPEIRSCDIVGNFSGSDAAGLRVNSPAAAGTIVCNSVFWDNAANGVRTMESQLYVPGMEDPLNTPWQSLLSHCTVQSWTGSGASGNNGSSPLFKRDPIPGDYGDLHLLQNSPCIDAGDGTQLPRDEYDLNGNGLSMDEALPVDFDGSQRQRGPLDRGPFEYLTNCTACPGERLWQSGTGGDFNVVSNWYPSIPNEHHDVLFDLNQSLTVHFPQNEKAASVTVRRGDVLLDLSVPGASGRKWSVNMSPTAATPRALTVGDQPFESATLRIQGGTLETGQGPDSILGDAANSIGNLVIADPKALLLAPGRLVVGSLGAGSLEISGGGKAAVAQLWIGQSDGGQGSVVVRGAGSNLNVKLSGIVGNVYSPRAGIDAALDIRDGGVLQEGGSSLLVLQNGRVQGNGTIKGSVVSVGEIAPGTADALGTLSITGNFDQLSNLGAEFAPETGRLFLRVGLDGAGQNFVNDSLAVTGAAHLAGVLTVSLSGPDIAAVRQKLAQASSGQSIPLVRAASLVDGEDRLTRFDVAVLPSLITDNAGRKYLKVLLPGAGAAVALAGTVQVALGTGDLSDWTPPVGADAATAPSTPTAATVADLDGDGLDDLVVTTSNGTQPGNCYVFFNRGVDSEGAWRGFHDPLVLGAGVGPSAVIAAQLRPTQGGVVGKDLILSNQADGTLTIYRSAVVQSSAGIGDNVPANAFGVTPEIVELGAGSEPVSLASGALASGHHLGTAPDPADVEDVAVACRGPREIRVFTNDGDGSLDPVWNAIPLLDEIGQLKAISPEQDPRRKSYLAAIGQSAAGDSTATIYDNQTDVSPGLYLVAASYPIAGHPVELRASSISRFEGQVSTGAGVPDLIVVSAADASGAGGLTLLLGDQESLLTSGSAPSYPARVFIAAGSDSIKGEPLSVAAVDIDRDGDVDLAVLTRDGASSSVEVLRNDLVVGGQTGSLSFAPESNTVTVGQSPVQVLASNLTVRNAVNKLDILGLNTPVLLRSGGTPPKNIQVARPVRTCPADLNGDHQTDDADFVLFATAYDLLDCGDRSMPAYCPADINGDGFVDDSDFVIFVGAYNALLCP